HQAYFHVPGPPVPFDRCVRTCHRQASGMRFLTSLLCLSAFAFAQDPVEGKKLFEIKCGVCHSTDTEELRIGPSLKGAKTGTLSSGRYATYTTILKRINEGGNGM